MSTNANNDLALGTVTVIESEPRPTSQVIADWLAKVERREIIVTEPTTDELEQLEIWLAKMKSLRRR